MTTAEYIYVISSTTAIIYLLIENWKNSRLIRIHSKAILGFMILMGSENKEKINKDTNEYSATRPPMPSQTWNRPRDGGATSGEESNPH